MHHRNISGQRQAEFPASIISQVRRTSGGLFPDIDQGSAELPRPLQVCECEVDWDLAFLHEPEHAPLLGLESPAFIFPCQVCKFVRKNRGENID